MCTVKFTSGLDCIFLSSVSHGILKKKHCVLIYFFVVYEMISAVAVLLLCLKVRTERDLFKLMGRP